MLVKITSLAATAAAILATPAMALDKPEPENPATEEPAAAAEVDDAFSELFGSWEALEEGGRVTMSGTIAPPPRAVISVPQRAPLEGMRLTSGYGMRDHPILRRRARHNGVDLAAPRGTPVYATADGTVEMARYFGSYGNYVQIGHGADMETRYAHLSSYTVSPGEEVRMGDLIGYVGSTGRSTGPHLHYEVRIAGAPVNPIPYMVAQVETDDSANAARGGPE